MARRLRYLVAPAALAACVVVAGASAAVIDVSSMPVQPSDLPGATQVSSGSLKPAAGYVSAYQRTYAFKAPNGPSQLTLIFSEVALATSVVRASADEDAVRRLYASKVGKTAVATSFAKLLKVKPSTVSVGPLRAVGAGDSSFGFAITMTLKGRRLYASQMYMRLDRVLVSQFVDGLRSLTGAATKLLGLTAAHIGAALTPQSATAPTVTGTPQAGQTLTASPGTWTVTPTSTAYQWQRCDQTGANCVDIEGATTNTYAVQQSDGGFTLRVNVTATNRFGSATTPSATVLVVV